VNNSVASPRNNRPKDNQKNSRQSVRPPVQPSTISPGAKKNVRKSNKNIFKENEMSDQKAIDLLKSVGEYRVMFDYPTPNDLDSTDPLDSFLMALL